MIEAGAPVYLRRPEAAKYVRERWGIPCATRTLAKIACISNDGPEMHYAGRIPLYTTESLDKWVLKKIRPPRSSTSDNRRNDHGVGATPGLRRCGPRKQARTARMVGNAAPKVPS
jgi:hypothetical protein